MGVLPGRAPLIGRLGYGELRIKSGGQTASYYVDGGYVQVADNVVAVLTNRAVPTASLDPAAAWRLLNEAGWTDADGDGVAETRSIYLSDLNAPFGMALVGQELYIANVPFMDLSYIGK